CSLIYQLYLHDALPIFDGIQTKEPAFGLPAKWINEDIKEDAEMFGYTVVDPPSVVSTHLTEVIKRHAHELLGRQETKDLIIRVQDRKSTRLNSSHVSIS